MTIQIDNTNKEFYTAFPEHNLIRCRTQLKLVADMEKKWPEMERVVRQYV